MKKKIWVVFLLCVSVMAITGCASSQTLKPHIEIWGYTNFDACFYGELAFYPRVITKKNVKVFSFSLFIDGVLLATDTTPERVEEYSVDFEVKVYPMHSWDSTVVGQGLHSIKGVAQTSSGELTVEKEITTRKYLTNVWLDTRGSSNNQVLVDIEKCDAGTTIPVSGGQVLANGVNLNWDDVSQRYISHEGTIIPGLGPGNTLVITYRIPGETEFIESYAVEELVRNVHTTDEVNRWLKGEINNLHLMWEVKTDLLHEINLQVDCYDSEMNLLGCNTNEIPEILTYPTECYLSRAVFPNETKYIEIYLSYKQLTPTSYYFPTSDGPAKTGYFLILQDTEKIKNF